MTGKSPSLSSGFVAKRGKVWVATRKLGLATKTIRSSLGAVDAPPRVVYYVP